ncbi:hypothetical protein [Cyanothece sp. BG0011]|nr:hypothetical protein [Cyanothece sp. BG0011]
MSDLNRGIMKFEGADKPVFGSDFSFLVLGAIIGLIIWALNAAYTVG